MHVKAITKTVDKTITWLTTVFEMKRVQQLVTL